jgi:hypothetical protein
MEKFIIQDVKFKIVGARFAKLKLILLNRLKKQQL